MVLCWLKIVTVYTMHCTECTDLSAWSMKNQKIALTMHLFHRKQSKHIGSFSSAKNYRCWWFPAKTQWRNATALPHLQIAQPKGIPKIHRGEANELGLRGEMQASLSLIIHCLNSIWRDQNATYKLGLNFTISYNTCTLDLHLAWLSDCSQDTAWSI